MCAAGTVDRDALVRAVALAAISGVAACVWQLTAAPVAAAPAGRETDILATDSATDFLAFLQTFFEGIAARRAHDSSPLAFVWEALPGMALQAAQG